MAREKLEDEEQLAVFEQKELEWVETLRKNRSRPLAEKLHQLKVKYLNFLRDEGSFALYEKKSLGNEKRKTFTFSVSQLWALNFHFKGKHIETSKVTF